MNRWHSVKRGRIIASCDAPCGDHAETLLAPDRETLVVSDADWRKVHHRRRLLRHGTPPRSAEQRVADVARVNFKERTS